MPNDEKASESYTTPVVKVVKSPSFIVEFGCTAYPNISIDSLSVTMPDSHDHETACGGSDFPQVSVTFHGFDFWILLDNH